MAGELSGDGTGRIGNCVSCGLLLPLRLAGPGEEDTNWACSGCGAQYGAVLDRSAPQELFHNVRPAVFKFDRSQVPSKPPEALAAFIQQMIGEGQMFANRRSTARHQLVVPVTAVPVDVGFFPIGEPFTAITRDISTKGLSLIHTRAVRCERLVVELPNRSGAAIQLVLQVARCRALGRFYEIAGPFTMRLGS